MAGVSGDDDSSLRVQAGSDLGGDDRTHVGLHTAPNGTNRTGLNDYVTNETLGPLVVIGEDWMDKHIARPFERRGHSRALVLLVRGFTSPMRSFADLFALHAPRYREDRQ